MNFQVQCPQAQPENEAHGGAGKSQGVTGPPMSSGYRFHRQGQAHFFPFVANMPFQWGPNYVRVDSYKENIRFPLIFKILDTEKLGWIPKSFGISTLYLSVKESNSCYSHDIEFQLQETSEGL